MSILLETIQATDTIALELRERGDGRVEIYRPDYAEVLDDFDTIEDAREAATMIAADIAWANE